MKLVHPTSMPGTIAIHWSNGDRTYGAPSRVGEPTWRFVLRGYIRRVRRRRSLRL